MPTLGIDRRPGVNPAKLGIDVDEPAGVVSTARLYNRKAPELRDERDGLMTEAFKKKADPNRGFLLQGGNFSKARGARNPAANTRRWKMPTFTVRPRSSAAVAPSDEDVMQSLPLANLLSDRGFGKSLIRKLCIDMSCSTVEQLLSLDRPQFDSLCDALRPLPGNREQLRNLVREQKRVLAEKRAQRRAEQQQQPASAVQEPPPSSQLPPSSAGAVAPARPRTAPGGGGGQQRQAWRAALDQLRHSSVAAKRGGDGHISHLIEDQPLHWGRTRGPAPPKHAYTSSVRVLSVRNAHGVVIGRRTVFEGEAPNSPAKGSSSRGRSAGGARKKWDPDVF
jgi:hypothetical protein